MINAYHDGKTLDLIAPVGGVTSGTPVQIGKLVVIPVADAAAGETFAGSHEGVFLVNHKAADAPAAGDYAYWDGAAGKFTTVAGALQRAGWFVSAEIGTSDTAYVKLGGQTV